MRVVVSNKKLKTYSYGNADLGTIAQNGKHETRHGMAAIDHSFCFTFSWWIVSHRVIDSAVNATHLLISGFPKHIILIIF